MWLEFKKFILRINDESIEFMVRGRLNARSLLIRAKKR